MELGDRKKLILKAIIEDYIATAEPVGSRTISKKYLTDVSPATIRNEMADLEEMGFIEQPHTSAGRVPSEKAYRMYVDGLIHNMLPSQHMDVLSKEFNETVNEIDSLVKHASKLLSQLTNYTAIVTMPQLSLVTLKKIQLIKVDTENILAVIITDAGIVRNSVIRLEENIPEDKLNRMNCILNEVLTGQCIADINADVIHALIVRMGGRQEIVRQIIVDMIKTLQYVNGEQIYHEGAANMLSLPEFRDIERAKGFFNSLEEKDTLLSLIQETSKGGLNVSIGSENKVEPFSDCSVITATYKVNGKTVGSIGVVGPTRMEYSKVISLVDGVRENMSEMLNMIMKLKE